LNIARSAGTVPFAFAAGQPLGHDLIADRRQAQVPVAIDERSNCDESWFLQWVGLP
jgi:hypothetical protein